MALGAALGLAAVVFFVVVAFLAVVAFFGLATAGFLSVLAAAGLGSFLASLVPPELPAES